MAYVFNPFTGTLDITGSGSSTPLAIGDTITGATQGSVLFVGFGGTLLQTNAEFFYDDADARLSIGTNSNYTAKLNLLVGSASEKGQVIRLAGSQTANALEVQNSGGTGLTCVNESGWLGVGVTSSLIAPLHVKSNGASAQFALQDTSGAGTASQMLWGWYDNVGVRQAYFFKSNTGSLSIANESNNPFVFVVNGNNVCSFAVASITATASITPTADNTYTLGDGTNYWNTIFSRNGYFKATSAAAVPMTIIASAAHSVNLVEIQTSGFTNLVTISKAGNFLCQNLAARVVSKTGIYTAADETVILCDATSGAFPINLPAAASSTNRQYTIKKTDSSTNAVTVTPNGAETIDGAATQALAVQYQSITITCDGSNWFII